MSPDRTVTPGSVALLALGSFAYAAMAFAWFSLPAYLPAVGAAFDLSGTREGLLVGAVPLTYVPIGLVSGLLTDRLGHRRVIGLGLAVVGAAQFLRGVATGFPTMLAATVLLGVGATGITFGLPKLVAALFPARRSGVASTGYLLGAFAGTAAAFGVGRAVAGPALGGWRPLFRLSGLAILGLAAVWAAAAAVGPAGEAPGAGESPIGALRGVLGSRSLRLLVVVGFVYLLVLHGLQGMLQTVFEARGASAERAARTTTVLVAARVGGLLAVPALADYANRRDLGLAGSVACCTLGTAALAADLLPLVAVVVAGIGLGGVSPLLRALPAEFAAVGPERTGVAVGLVFAVGEVGGFAGPFAIGALADRTGSYAAGLGVLCLATVAALAAAVALGAGGGFEGGATGGPE